MKRYLSLFLFCCTYSLFSEGIEYDHIQIPLQEKWNIKEESGYALFTRAGKNGGVVIIQSVQGDAALLEKFLSNLINVHTEGRQILKMFPGQIAAGKTKSGYNFAGQGRVTKSEKDIWYCQYFAIELKGNIQGIIIFSDQAETFKEISSTVAKGIEQVSMLATKIVPSTKLPAPSQSQSMFEKTGIMHDQFVTGVITSQSAQLKPVSFRLTGSMRMSADDLILSGRDENGNIYLTRDATGLSPYPEQVNEIHRVSDFKNPAGTGITREFLMKAVSQLAKMKVDLFFKSTSHIHQLAVDKKGNLFIGQTIENDNAFFYRSLSGDISLIASPQQLNKISGGYNTNRDASRIKPTARGNAWLFVQGVEQGSKNYGTLAYALLKSGDVFKAKMVTPSWKGKSYDRVAAYSFFKNVMIDPDENIVFYKNHSFWRMEPSGNIKEILRLPIPSSNVTVSGPVILDNGDIWIAFSTDYSVTSYVDVSSGTADVRNTWFMVGDRSRLVRIRIRGNQVELGEISSERILGELKKTGLTRKDSGVMKTAMIRPDFKSGGIVLVDSHHNILYGIQAND